MKVLTFIVVCAALLNVLGQDCNVPNCNQCVAGDPKKCQFCDTKYYISSSQCYPCLAHCDSCQGSYKCQLCEADYEVSKGIIYDTCVVKNCRVPSCNKCDTTDADICVTCASSAYLNSTDKQCYNCSQNCATCKDSAAKCTSCFTNYTLETATSECVVRTCVAEGCDTCVRTNATLCTVCKPGYYLDLTSQTCGKCSANCLTCETNSTFCTSCHPNYDLNSTTGQCEVSKCQVPYCNKCNTTDMDRCVECVSSTFINEVTGKCDNCTQGCANCTNSETCERCDDLYVKNENNKCDHCPENCLKCDSKTTCTTCAPFTILNSSGLCEPCPANCKTCAPGNKCLACEDKFGLNSTTGQCDACPANCLSCTGANSCSSCISGFGVNSSTGLCEVCPDNCLDCEGSNKCKACIDGYGVNSTTSMCDACPRNCKSCSGSFTCDQCFEHYAFNATSIACEVSECLVNNCTKCEVYNHTLCESCDSRFFVESQSGQCSSCLPRCLTCSNDTVCLGCEAHYDFNATSSQCETSECQVSNCSKCKVTDAYGCEICAQSFFLQNSSLCSSCPLNCLSCQNGVSCDTCAPNHAFNATTAVCECQNSPNCMTCNAPDSSTCAACKGGFFLNDADKLCKSCTLNCLSCQDGTSCATCAANHSFNSSTNTCECATSANCQTCDSTDSSKCAVCKPDFTKGKDTSLCYQCPLNCKSCSSGDSCDQCAEGHTFNNVTKTCECTGAANCQTCNPTDPSKCSSCKAGFFLDQTTSGCSACAKNCLQCSNAANCTSCAQNYTVENATGRCIVSSCQAQFCDKCVQTDAFTCAKCLNGTFLNGSQQCEFCAEKERCNICSGKSTCTECNPQYTLNTNTSKCYLKKCSPEHCSWCYESQGICEIAEARYFIDDKGTVRGCPPGCVTCNSTTSCSQCDPNTAFDKEKLSCLAPKGSKAWVWILVSIGIIAIIAVAVVLYLRKSKPVDDELEAPLTKDDKASSAGVL